MKATYPPVYHAACAYLVKHGDAHDRPGLERALARLGIARVLQAVRHQYGRERAIRERNHLRQIAGVFPARRALEDIDELAAAVAADRAETALRRVRVA